MRLVHIPWGTQLCENRHQQHGSRDWWCLEVGRSLRSLINTSITWIDTAQGDEYWRNIHLHLRDRE